MSGLNILDRNILIYSPILDPFIIEPTISSEQKLNYSRIASHNKNATYLLV